MTIYLKFLRQIDPTNCKSGVNHDPLELHSATEQKGYFKWQWCHSRVHVRSYTDGLYVQLKKH